LGCESINRLTQAEWETASRQKHDDFYDYSRVNYIDAKTKIEIRCKKHDVWFNQTPDKHKSQKFSCPECQSQRHKASVDKRRLTFEEFKTKIESLHGEDILDLSQVVYVNNRTKVKVRHISCDHWYEVAPANLFKKGNLGCSKCRYTRAGESHPKKKSTEQWIAEARETHGDLYLYHSEYTNNKGMMDIECTICDTKFSQEAKSHATYGQGCPKCRYVKSAAGTRLDFDEVLERLETRRQETGKHYKYPNLTAETYKRTRDKCEIVCPDCDRTFSQTLAKHIDRQQGCSACATTGFQTGEPGYCYLLEYQFSDGTIRYKQGIAGDVKSRVSRLRRNVNDVFPETKVTLIDQKYFEVGQDARDLETYFLSLTDIRWTPDKKFDGFNEMYAEGILEAWAERL